MTSLRGVYSQRLSTTHIETRNSEDLPITIHVTVDLVTAINNTQGMVGYDPSLPLTTGFTYVINATAPNGTIRKYRSNNNNQVEEILLDLNNPNANFYRENPLLLSKVVMTNKQGDTKTFQLKGYGAGFTTKDVVFSAGGDNDFNDDNIAFVHFDKPKLNLTGDEWRSVTGYYLEAFYKLVVFGERSLHEFHNIELEGIAV